MPPSRKNPGAPDDAEKSPSARGTPLSRRQRLENMGLLSTRVAHDLNNMLSPMQMAIPVLREAVTDPASRDLLDTVEATVARATALVRQILEYSHGEGGRLQLALMQHLLEEIVSFATETFPRNISVRDKIAANLWRTNANLGQIHQVLLNLCVNAREAMPSGGVLYLGAENRVLDASDARAIEGGRPGAFVVLVVEDSGPGFSPSVLEHLWEPFVTTKKGGAGTGLGLSTVREIIANHEGFIHLRTAPNQGASFSIFLPAVDAPPLVQTKSAANSAGRVLSPTRA